jgi:hypothetical protein
MAVTDLDSPMTGHASRGRRALMLPVSLGLAVAAQTGLALGYGSAPSTARDLWSVALVLCLMLALPSLGVIWATWTARGQKAGWRMGLLIAGAGVLMRAPYFGAGPMLEDDHFRYLLDGAMTAHGLSPYAHSPAALLDSTEGALRSVVEPGRSMIAAINFPELRSIYPGGAQALFALAHLVAPWKLDGLRAVIVLAEALTAMLLWRWLVSSGRPPQLVALFWCNPLMAFCLTGQAHIDAALGPPILLALLAARRRQGALAGFGLGFAVGVKLWPILLAPLLMRALWPDRRALASFAVALGLSTLALCAALMLASLSADAGLIAYASGWSVNNGPYAWASYLFFLLFGPGVGEGLLRAMVVLTALGASIAVAARPCDDRDDLAARATLLAAALFYLSPAQFPWYAAWFTPLAAASGSWALAAASIGLPIYYLFFPLAAIGLRDVHGYGLAFAHLAPVLLTVLLMRTQAPAGARA